MAVMTLGEMQSRILAKAAQDKEFRADLIENPRGVISEELGVRIPETFDFQIHENTATTGHLVLPPSESLTEEELEMVVGGGGSGTDWSPD